MAISEQQERVDRLAQVLQQISQLAAESGDHAGLPRGRWPQAVDA